MGDAGAGRGASGGARAGPPAEGGALAETLGGGGAAGAGGRAGGAQPVAILGKLGGARPSRLQALLRERDSAAGASLLRMNGGAGAGARDSRPPVSLVRMENKAFGSEFLLLSPILRARAVGGAGAGRERRCLSVPGTRLQGAGRSPPHRTGPRAQAFAPKVQLCEPSWSPDGDPGLQDLRAGGDSVALVARKSLCLSARCWGVRAPPPRGPSPRLRAVVGPAPPPLRAGTGPALPRPPPPLGRTPWRCEVNAHYTFSISLPVLGER